MFCLLLDIIISWIQGQKLTIHPFELNASISSSRRMYFEQWINCTFNLFALTYMTHDWLVTGLDIAIGIEIDGEMKIKSCQKWDVEDFQFQSWTETADNSTVRCSKQTSQEILDRINAKSLIPVTKRQEWAFQHRRRKTWIPISRGLITRKLNYSFGPSQKSSSTFISTVRSHRKSSGIIYSAIQIWCNVFLSNKSFLGKIIQTHFLSSFGNWCLVARPIWITLDCAHAEEDTEKHGTPRKARNPCRKSPELWRICCFAFNFFCHLCTTILTC